MIDVTSSFRGLSFSTSDLISQISQTGWELDSVKFEDKGGAFVAEAHNPHGEAIKRTGNDEKRALSNLLIAITRRHNLRTTAQWKVGMWKTNWVDQLQPIAEAYAKADVYNPKAMLAYQELGNDSLRRAEALSHHLKIDVTDDPMPYRNIKEMQDDIHKKRHYVVSRYDTDHPIWNTNQHVAYRTVHDVLGHAVSGGDYGWRGTNLAAAAHMPLLSENAQNALFTESVAKRAFMHHYGMFPIHKIVTFPQFMEPIAKQENPGPGYSGIHPSQSLPPVAVPEYKEPNPKTFVPPHLEFLSAWGGDDTGPEMEAFTPTVDQTNRYLDPNHGYNTGFDPIPQSPVSAGNAYMYHEDPLESDKVRDTAALINTDGNNQHWADMNANDPGELARMKQAIVNAFRVVLLSPRKDLRWNAVHYQAIAGIPGDVSDPTVYWNTLEKARQNWNVQRFGEQARYQHMPYWKYLKRIEKIVYQMNPQDPDYQKRVGQMLFDWVTEEHEKAMEADSMQPEAKQKSADAIDRDAVKALVKRMDMFIREHNPKMDRAAVINNWVNRKRSDVTTQTPYPSVPGYPLPEKTDPEIYTPPGQKPAKYGAFMGTHLKAISQVSMHVDELLKAALEDVHEGGAGYHFRSAVLQLGISGVGPKVASFAWLLLQPMTSQLATIDTHIMDTLGVPYDKNMSNRDYFKFERMLAAGRDASGYSHVPLGQFQWGMWDMKRTGQGSHQDHSAMKVLDPTPHENIDWAAKMQPINAEQAVDYKNNWLGDIAPQWWQETQPYRDEVARQWDEQMSTAKTPKGKVPWNASQPLGATPANVLTASRKEANIPAPWFVHPQTGLHTIGSPGQTVMQHARQQLNLSTPEVWMALGENAGKS